MRNSNGALVLATAAVTILGPQQSMSQTGAEAILEEVVVTARRREENLEDLPMSIVAISGEALQTQGVYNTQHISDLAANVSLSESDTMGQSQIFIRGIGGGFSNPVAIFGTGMYIDGHYLPGSISTYMSTVDVERVEVLRGPQGTLFGKNVTGGAINFITRKPQNEFEADVTLRAGQYGQQDLRGMVNVPFADDLYGRFSVASEQSDGWVTNRITGRTIDYQDARSIRGALRYEPGDRWTIDFSVNSERQRHGQNPSSCRVHPDQDVVDALANRSPGGEDEEGNPLLPGSDPAVAAAHPPQIYDGPTFDDGVGSDGGLLEVGEEMFAYVGGSAENIFPGGTLAMWSNCATDLEAGDFSASDEKDEFTKSDSASAFLAANWDSGGAIGGLDNLSFRLNASWRDTDYSYLIDLDNTPLNVKVQGQPGVGNHSTTDNLELVLDADVNDRLSVLLGLYSFDEESRTGNGECWRRLTAEFLPNIDDNPDVPCPLSNGGLVFSGSTTGIDEGFLQQVNVWNDSTAVFGHMTYELAEDWHVELGARWTEDAREFNIVEFPFECVVTDPASQCSGTPIINADAFDQGGFFNSAQATFDEVTPMASLSRRFEGGSLDDGMVYFLISEGFLTGSFNDELNPTVDPTLAPYVVYQPELVRNYEVGFKGEFAGGRARVTADIFYMDYTDKQEELEIPNPNPAGGEEFIEFVTNASQVDITGIEFELRASPWDAGFVTVDASRLVNEYGEFLVPDVDNPGVFIDLTNSAIEDRTPEWTLNASVGHTFLLGNGHQITSQFGVYAQAGYEWLTDELDSPASFCFQDSYTKLRARITYVSPAARNWEASLYGSNVTDERYLADCKVEDPSGTYVVRYNPPARWGLEFVARFGD